MAVAINDGTGDRILTRNANKNFLENRNKVKFDGEKKEHLPMWIHLCSVRRVRISSKGGENCAFCDCGDEQKEESSEID